MEYEENILQDNASGEDLLPSDQDTSLEDKLDRIEALLNEDITLRSQENEVVEDLQENEQQGADIYTTGSGVDNDVVPNYSQYIYDLLTDSSIKVEIVDDRSIFDKELNDYSVAEAIGVVGLMLGFICIIVAFINRYTPKRR